MKNNKFKKSLFIAIFIMLLFRLLFILFPIHSSVATIIIPKDYELDEINFGIRGYTGRVKCININESFDKLKLTFNKIINLPEEKSDNQGRVKLIKEFSSNWFKQDCPPRLLDIGSGLGVFPFSIKNLGWECLAIDPDKKAIKHIKNLGVKALCADFREVKPDKKFDIITLNKVLEHLVDPIKFLKETKPWLSNEGFLYLELPDGELAFRDSPHREEFFIEHIHIFSISSTISLIRKANFLIHNISRIKEPSGKYTIRAFISPE